MHVMRAQVSESARRKVRRNVDETVTRTVKRALKHFNRTSRKIVLRITSLLIQQMFCCIFWLEIIHRTKVRRRCCWVSSWARRPSCIRRLQRRDYIPATEIGK